MYINFVFVPSLMTRCCILMAAKQTYTDQITFCEVVIVPPLQVYSTYSIRQRKEDFSSNLCVQTGSGAHPASCTMGTGGPFPGCKVRPRRDAYSRQTMRWSLRGVNILSAVRGEYRACRWTEDFLLVRAKMT
jgi:hypothetical protein